jgi:hypothetical protein
VGRASSTASSPEPSAATTTSPSAAASTSPDGADATPSTFSEEPADTGAADSDEVPAGFRLQEDPTGFRVAVPAGWTRSVRGTSTYYRDPRSGAYLQVDQTTRPKADALADWRRQEASAPGRFPGYRRIRLERVDYGGWNAADWEFTWQSGGSTVHVLNRNVRVNDAQAYALYWSVPDREWTARRADFDVVARTFRPAS